MSIRKGLSLSAFVVFPFPLALLLIYWEYTYFNGHPIEQTIPSFPVFVALAVLLVLETLFRYEKAVSQRRLVLRDLASTAVNVLFTRTVATSLLADRRVPSHGHVPALDEIEAARRLAVMKQHFVLLKPAHLGVVREERDEVGRQPREELARGDTSLNRILRHQSSFGSASSRFWLTACRSRRALRAVWRCVLDALGTSPASLSY